MPRNGSGIYSVPTGTAAVSGTPVASSPYNAFLADLVSDANAARPITAGGTGATDAATALSNLGGMATDADLAAIAALGYSAKSLLTKTAANTWTLTTISSNVESILGAADYAAIKVLLGLVIGTNVQAYNANLTTYAGIAPSANVQTLLGAADFAAFKTSLSLNNVDNTSDATKNAASVTLTNKTLSSPTLSGTVGGSPTASGIWTFSGGQQVFNGIGTSNTSANANINLKRTTGQFGGFRIQGLTVAEVMGYSPVGSDDFAIGFDAGVGIVERFRVYQSNGLVTITGSIQAPVAVSSETSGTLTSASANKHLALTGNITLNNSVFTANDKMTMDPGTSARTITRGAGCTMYVNGTDSATATLAANQMGGVHVRSASVFVLTGAVS